MKKRITSAHLEVPQLGEFARQITNLCSSDLESCLVEQQTHGGRLGDLLVARGLLTKEELQEALRSQARWAARLHSRDMPGADFPLPSTFSLCMPCYNEADVIEDCLEGALLVLPEFLDEFEILVVDDGSKDKTSEVVAAYAERDSRVRLLRHEVNQGYGAAVTTGLKAARGEFICFTDGDGQFNMLDLARLLVRARQADVVIGYRYDRADAAIRKLNAKSWNFLIRTMLGVRVRDLDCAFKLFPRWIVEGLQLTAQGACISAEIMVQVSRSGVSVCEVPVNHFPRYRGDSTGANLGVVAKAFRELPSLWKYRRTEGLATVRPEVSSPQPAFLRKESSNHHEAAHDSTPMPFDSRNGEASGGTTELVSPIAKTPSWRRP